MTTIITNIYRSALQMNTAPNLTNITTKIPKTEKKNNKQEK